MFFAEYANTYGSNTPIENFMHKQTINTKN